jgi:prepilin-type N-terminal cleavage/methylation domain-containing protein
MLRRVGKPSYGQGSSVFARPALTLLEVVVVIAIIAILAALLIPAVLNVRRSALAVHSLNNLRQMAIAAVNYAGDHRGNLPRIVPPPSPELPVHCALLPYVEQDALFKYMTTNAPVNLPSVPDRSPAVYRNPLDPSTTEYSPLAGGYSISSYVCNAQVFLARPNLQSTFADGTSNTLLFSEQYAWYCRGTMFVYMGTWVVPRSLNGGVVGNLEGQTRPTFADFACGDFHPALTGKTFQVAPALGDCDPRMLNSSTSSGLQVGLADGSARNLAAGISPAVYWGLITPNGGEPVQFP